MNCDSHPRAYIEHIHSESRYLIHFFRPIHFIVHRIVSSLGVFLYRGHISNDLTVIYALEATVPMSSLAASFCLRTTPEKKTDPRVDDLLPFDIHTKYLVFFGRVEEQQLTVSFVQESLGSQT